MLLYRFRPFNQNTITELLTEKLHFSHPSTWNDPFEYGSKDEKDICKRYICFSKNINDAHQDMLTNFLMWSHYAESHKGICTEYEYDGSNKKTNWYISYNNANQKDNGEIKHTCWTYENEFRFCTTVDKNKYPNFQGVNIPYTEIGLKIKAIYCGVKFTDFETLQTICGNRDFEIYDGDVENYASINFQKITT